MSSNPAPSRTENRKCQPARARLCHLIDARVEIKPASAENSARAISMVIPLRRIMSYGALPPRRAVGVSFPSLSLLRVDLV